MTDPTSSTPEPTPIPTPEPNPIPAPEPSPTAAPNATPAAAPYQATPYAAASGPQAKTNTLAVVALVLGFLLPLGGIIVGHIALGQIKKTGEAGRGLALAGTVLGYVLTIGGILFGIGFVILGIIASANAPYDAYNYNY